MDTSATARSEFATRLYDRLARDHAGKNLFLSPFSIRVALAMCAVGARGETRQEMIDLIGASESVDEQNRQYAEKVFDKADTRNEDWHGPKTCKAPMMRQSGGYLYYDGDDFQALNLPYKGRQLSMLVVLPRKKDGLAALENRWAKRGTFRQVTDGFDAER